MRILGIDPGTGRTGFGVIDISAKNGHGRKLVPKQTDQAFDHLNLPLLATLVTFGCIETPKEEAMPKRLIQIRREIHNLLGTFSPDVVSIELLFFGVNSRTAMTVGQARGVVLEAVAELDVPIFEYQGLQVKRVISGSGKSDKKAMQEVIRTIFQLETVPKPDDAADGLAIALCHALSVMEQGI